jgi:hypothetical protein
MSLTKKTRILVSQFILQRNVDIEFDDDLIKSCVKSAAILSEGKRLGQDMFIGP